MEVLHGDIRITLSDAEAIRGLERTRVAVKRGMAQLSREKAEISITGDLTNFKRSLKEAEALAKKHRANINDLEAKRGGLSGAALNSVEKKLAAERESLKTLDKQIKLDTQRVSILTEQLQQQKQSNKEAGLSTKQAKLREQAEHAVADAITKQADATQRAGRMQSQAIKMDEDRTKRIQEGIVKEGQLRARAEREMERALKGRETDQRAMLRAQQQALDLDQKRTIETISHTQEVAKLRQEYNKASAALQRMNQQGLGKRLGRAASPDAKQEFEINQSKAIGEMEVLRAKLAAMGEKPIDIHVDVKQSRVMEKLLGIGDIGTRLGPFSGTLKQFSVAALALGPILVGLLGTVTALAGAVGAGLAGGLGVAGAAATAFGLSLGGVGFATASLFRDFKNLNTMQDAYHKQVLKTGANSEKAKTKLDEFNHALGAVSPSARAAFTSFDQLQTHWRGMTQAMRPEFLEALGSTFTTLNSDFALFSRGTRKAFTEVTQGWETWMEGLRGAEAQNIIFTLMDNANRAIKPLMEGLGHLGAAWGRIATSFSRYLPAITGGFDKWAGGLDKATQNTEKLNTGVDGLMGSLKSTGSVLYAFGRVIVEMSKAAMGPGGGMLDGIANGLNGIADAIHRDPSGLHDFFAESIQTVEALYGVLQPLAALFIEFSTIMRPATTAILSVLGPIADFTKWLASLSGIHAALQAWGTLWLFKKGTALIVGSLAGSVNVLAAAMTRLGKAQAGAKLEGLVAAGTRGGAATTAATAAAARGATSTSKVPAVVTTGGTARTVAAGATEAREAATVGKMAKFGGALSAVTTGLLGVSAPVAGLGLAAVGAGFAIKGMVDASKARAAQEKRITDHFGRDAVPTERKPVGVGRLGAFGATPQQHAALSTGIDTAKQRAELDKLATSVDDVNNALFQSGQIQRQLVSTGSQLQNSHLMLEQAEKNYADAVKNGGKHSLEARMALQQLRDARTQDSQATKAWASQSRDAMNWMSRAVAKAQAAFEAARGTGAESDMRKKLEAAKNSAAALTINLGRAKKGMDIFTGEGAQKIGAFIRQYGNIPGVKRILLQVETQQSAEKIARVIGALEKVGKRKTVTRILADAKNPTEALRLLNAALDKWERRHPVAELRTDKQKAQNDLNAINAALTHYGNRKPQALLDAKDAAEAKIKRLEKQLDHLNGRKADVGVDINFHLPKDFQSAGSVSSNAMGGDRGSGDGWGVPNIAGAVKGFAMKQGGKLSSMMLGAGGLGGFPASGTGLNAFNGIAQKFGLTVGSGFRPGAITSSGNVSNHALGRARDFPGAPSQMMAFAKFMARMYGSRLKELIYTPLGWSIKNGQRVPPYAQSDHYDHVHVAMAQGGERPRSGKYTQPTVLFAEEPNRPEYFISTNPRDKKRSQALITQAAADVGMIEHSALFNSAHPVKKFKSGGVRGKGLSAVGKFDKEQQRIIQTALAIAKSLGAPTKATKALIAALLDESGARNLKYGSGSSTGPLQLLSGTAKDLGVNPRDTKAVIKLFLTKGFTGKGGAIKLAGNKRLTAADVAAKVQGNKRGAPDYARFMGKASAILKATNFKPGPGGLSSLGGAKDQQVEIPTHGPSSNLAIKMANAQGRLDWAGTTAMNYQDDINAIYGYDTRAPARRRLAPNRNQGRGRIPTGKGRHRAPAGGQRGNTVGTVVGGVRGGLAPAPRPKLIHHEGMIDVLNQQDDAGRARLGTINDKLKGRLTKSKRADLLSEKEQIRTTLSGNRIKKKELRTQASEAEFERSQGKNSRIRNDYRTAKAGSTATLNDDITAAKAEAQYYKSRESFAKSRGDIAGAAEARTALNSANQSIQQYEDQIAQSGLSYQTSLAQATKGLDDDIAVAKASVSYWTAKRDMALAAGDIVGAADAQQQINSATDQITSFTDQIKEEQRRFQEGMIGYFEGQAKLTGTLTDDLDVATKGLSYWQDRLKEAQLSGDTEGAFAAAGQVQNYTSTVQGLQEDMKRLPMERDLAIAQMTTSMTDDAAALGKLRDYWQGRLAQAQKDGDLQGQIEAAGNVQNYSDNLAKLQEDMKRLPLERDRAFAALTDDTGDDKKATIALRDYWAKRLEEVKASGDIQGQIEAAGNLQNLNSEIKDAEQNVATQMVLLSEARRDLYRTFGSNFIPTIPQAAANIAPSAPAGNGGTVVNLTVNGADLAQDPHTWSQGVAWEIQAAV